ncbi:hypothetical protein Franean1_4503 [Parafrankia sp. EAN1pec]|nr:hypothetical protein Franean1_4503 [Frankia sp. EAN1pec]
MRAPTPAGREDMITIIRTAADQGVTLFDTVEAYGPFESERIVGEALNRSGTRSSSRRSSGSTSTWAKVSDQPLCSIFGGDCAWDHFKIAYGAGLRHHQPRSIKVHRQ